MSNFTLQLLLTGNELMTGDVIDTNSAMIAKQVSELGIDINRRVTISDDMSSLVCEIEHMSKQCDVLIINGGLGPTTDDLTSEALATVCNQPLIENQQAINHLNQWAKNRSFTLDKANLKQAWLPQNADIIYNRTGSAVGIHIKVNDCEIYCTPGVPSELKIMMEEEIIPSLTQKVPNHDSVHITRLQTFGIGESRLQTMVDNAFPDWPNSIQVGYRADSPTVELKLITRSSKAHQLKTLWLPKIQELLNDNIISEIKDTPVNLPSSVVSLLKEKQLTLTTAESCTGGLIASQITSISGASSVYEAGFVTYSNTIKENVLNVRNKTINSTGAVSKETVIEMAKGAIDKANADIAIAVSGIAGPSGGTPDKPVGTVWIAWGTRKNMQTQHFIIKGNRQYFQRMVAARSLDLVRRLLIESKHKPLYVHNYE